MKLLFISLLSAFLFSCAAFDGDPNTTVWGTTVGNEQIDIDLGDGKLLGSRELYLAGVTGLELAVINGSQAPQAINAGLLYAKDKVGDAEELLSTDEAYQKVLNSLLACDQPICQTTLGSEARVAFVEEAVPQLSDLTKRAQGVTATTNDVIDALLVATEINRNVN